MKTLTSDSQILDKARLIGSCVLLPVEFDTGALLDEFFAISKNQWGTKGGRVGVHLQAEAIFLRGFAPAEGDLPIEDRPLLATLPAFRSVIYNLFDAQPLRCLLAKLQPSGVIPKHIDKGGYFDRTLRIHIPIVTNEQSTMTVNEREFHMRVGEVWVINNCAVHGVENGHPTEARTHLICDYLPSEHLLGLLESGRRKQLQIS